MGFLQLCADRRFHRATMLAFEEATGLGADAYWIEAGAGGAPSWAEPSMLGRLAYDEGAIHMGWAAHGDVCRGFPGETNQAMREKLERTARQRAAEFPRAAHYLLFADESGVAIREVRSDT